MADAHKPASTSTATRVPPEAGTAFRGKRGPHGLSEALAFLLPLAASATQVQGGALFRTDGALLAALDGQPGFQGNVSTFLGQLCLILPLGNHAYRVALPGALFAGLGSLAILHLCHALFRKQGGSSRLDGWLALGAALSVSLSLAWMSEATVAGGAAVAAGLSLILLRQLVTVGFPRTVFGAALSGVVYGALFSESVWCAGLIALSALICWPESNHWTNATTPTARRLFVRLSALLVGALTTAVACLLPALTSQSIAILDTWSRTPGAGTWPLWSALEWMSAVGLLWTGGAIVGTIFGLSDRRPLLALAAWAGVDILAPGLGSTGWTDAIVVDSSRLGLHLTGLAVIGPLGALGLRTLGETAQALRLFAARPIAALLAVLAIAGCLASAEDSLRTLDQTGTRGPQIWTEEALDPLPEGTLVLTKSRAWGMRLLSAQAQGERPDVLVVPLDEVTRPKTLQAWLEREPALELLLRDLSISDTPSERAITRLVDTRPVYVEPNPSWDTRLLEHLLPSVPLAAFSSHAVGRSDRLATLEEVSAPTARIVDAAGESLRPDNATRALLLQGYRHASEALGTIDHKAKARLDELAPYQQPENPESDKTLAPVAAL